VERAPQFFTHARLPSEPDLGAPALIGVSGGRDSVALLHWLHALGYKKLIVCHLDHALRKASRADRDFVARLAKRLGMKMEAVRLDVKALAKRSKRSIETAARNARYEYFAKIAKKHRCSHVFLAHHADDQAETFLFNLLRGSGMAGLGGMKVTASRVIQKKKLTLLRPWVAVWREEIERYVVHHKLKFREDESNTDPAYTRNRIRHTVLPFLNKAMERDVRRALWRAAEICRADDEFIATQLPAVGSELSVPALRAMSDALQRRSIQAWLLAHGVKDVGFEEIEAVRSLLMTTTAKVNLPEDRHAFRRTKRIHLSAAPKSH